MFEFLDMKVQTSNFAAGSRIRNTKQEMKKLGQKGAWPRSRNLLLNFGTPLLSPVRMELQTSNFAAGSMVRYSKQKKKSRSKGAWSTSRDLLFKILGPPTIFLERVQLVTSNLVFRFTAWLTNQKCKSRSKRGGYFASPTFIILGLPLYLWNGQS